MKSLACGCPGSNVRTIERPAADQAAPAERQTSELRQWPTQLHLVPPTAPYLQIADLLIAADWLCWLRKPSSAPVGRCRWRLR